ncbi:hypothetical protein E4U43_002314 [Claviceps pusilla]|uniref:Uncharacterized protein n=1 Tax=Claviceps pusilla TaxID=123648 RepID=A0A9P7NHZ6_9HYPO|nr:hypothetical protein E4U43_002314 [Claviceps pusilla]
MRLMAYATGRPLNAAYIVARYPRSCKNPVLYGHKSGKVLYDVEKGQLFWMTQAAGDSLLREHERRVRETRRPSTAHEHPRSSSSAQVAPVSAEQSAKEEDETAGGGVAAEEPPAEQPLEKQAPAAKPEAEQPPAEPEST